MGSLKSVHTRPLWRSRNPARFAGRFRRGFESGPRRFRCERGADQRGRLRRLRGGWVGEAGLVAAEAAGRRAVVVGLDKSEAMLAIARRRHPEIEFVEGSV